MDQKNIIKPTINKLNYFNEIFVSRNIFKKKII